MRKPGKLPSKSIGVDFKQSAGKGAAYFGKDRLEMHEVLSLLTLLNLLTYYLPAYYCICVLYIFPLTTVKVYACIYVYLN